VGTAILKNMDGKADPVNATKILIKDLKGTI
jgi:hypothetical protein